MKLIESYLPMEALARAAANEARAGKGAPSSLHLWWGNRQLSIARALVFAQLVDAPEFGDVEKASKVRGTLEGLLRNDPLVEPVARELIAQSCGDEWPTVYDPFCGIGTVPFAALSLGVPALGGELNPVAAFVARLATGSERSDITRDDVRHAIAETQSELARRVLANYPAIKVTPSMAKDRPDIAKYVGRTLKVSMWLWARTVPDPSPAFGSCPVPLVSNFVTGAIKGRESWVDVELLKTKKDYKFVIRSGVASKEKTKGTRLGTKADFVSVFDGRPITSDYIREQGNAGKFGVRLMAIFADGEKGEKVVLSPTKDQEKIATECVGEGGDVPLTDNQRDTKAFGYGFKTYGELFLPRQKKMLSELAAIIARYAVRGVKESEVAKVLALAYSQFVSWHSTANTYWNERQFPRNVFTRQAIPFTWDFVEGNPIEASLKKWEDIASGAAERYFDIPLVPPGVVRCEDVAGAKTAKPMVVNTELPYYDNVAYADLADFFYAWLRPILKVVAPDLAVHRASPRAEELTAFPYRFGGREAADRFYCEGVARALKHLRQNCRTDCPAVFAFDFRSATFNARDIRPVGAFVEGLVDAGFTITAAWPLRDMRSSGVFGGEAGEGYRSIFFVCRPSRVDAEIATKRQFVDYLKAKLPTAIRYYEDVVKSGETSDYASRAFVAGIRLYSDFAKILNADGSVFPVTGAIEEVLKVAEELKTTAPHKEKNVGLSAEGLRNGIVDRLKRGEKPAEIRKEVYAAYLRCEDDGETALASQYNEILNEWNDLVEEMTK